MRKLILLLPLIVILPSHPQDEMYIRVYANTTMTDGGKAYVVLEEDFNEFVRLMKEAQAQLAAKQQEIDDLIRQRQALVEARDRDQATKKLLVSENVAAAAERAGATVSVDSFDPQERQLVEDAVRAVITKRLPTPTPTPAVIAKSTATPTIVVRPTETPRPSATPVYTPTPTMTPTKLAVKG